MKKIEPISKYNCYRNCKTMLTCEEALQQIEKEGLISADELLEIETKKVLYETLFRGFENTDEQREAFQKKKETILTGADKKEYGERLQKNISASYPDARNEFVTRIRSIDKRSTAGSDTYRAIDLELVLKENYPLSEFTKISNLPVEIDYSCNDEGISLYQKGEYVKISEPIIIKSLFRDDDEREYMELEYYDYELEQAKTILYATKNISNNNYDELIGKGIIIHNAKLFTSYLNMLRAVDKKKHLIPKGNAQMRYGFPVREDGTYDFGRFIGIGSDRILCVQDELRALSKVIFNERGTVSGFIDFLGEVSKGKYMIDFQMVTAASLSGLVLSAVNNGSDFVAPPVFIFCGQTSIGKNLLCALANNIWCTPSQRASLRCTSGSSIAYYQALKNFLNQLPVIIEDIQDLIDSQGQDAVTELVFNHSLGHSGGKCQSDGNIRANECSWGSPLLAMTEVDIFTENPSICGGADARYAVINLNVKEKERLTEKELNTYIAEQNENAGVYAKEVIKEIGRHEPKEILEWYQDNVKQLKKKGMIEKNANSFSLLLTTFQLLESAGLIPGNWKGQMLTADTLVDWIGVKEAVTSDEKVYQILCEEAVKDISFVPVDDKHFDGTQEAFDIRNKSAQEVRGRICYQKKCSGEYIICSKSERDRSLLLIPKRQLMQSLKYIEEENGIKGFGFNQKNWFEKGWLLKPKGKDYQFRGGAFQCPVTRALDAKNRERFYAIVLREDATLSEEELPEEYTFVSGAADPDAPSGGIDEQVLKKVQEVLEIEALVPWNC